MTTHNNTISATLLALCEKRASHGSICPSEVARALWPADWRSHMDAVRNCARTLAQSGQIEITQRGVARDPSAVIVGAIRYRLKNNA